MKARPSTLGATLLLLVTGAAVLAPWLAPYDPAAQVAPPFGTPNGSHLLGTNDIGQDLLSELIWGARVSLALGAVAALAATGLGLAVGVLASCFGRTAGMVLMRVVDVVLALPLLPLALVVGVFLRPGPMTETMLMSGVLWARPARQLRAQALTVRQHAYVDASTALGGGASHIALRHVLPALLPLAVPQYVRAATLAIQLEASLSFLGLGDPTAQSWGTMLYFANARGAFLTSAWQWWVVPAGACIGITVLGFALLGFSLEELASPRLRPPARASSAA